MSNKILSGFIALCIIFSCTACGKVGNPPAVNITAAVSASAADTSASNITIVSASDSTQKKEEGKKVLVEIPAPSLAKNMIGEPDKQQIAIYLPQAYDSSTKKYPVMYYLGGWASGIDGTGDAFTLIMNKFVAEGSVKDMILVCISGKSKLFGSFFANSPVTGNWEDFVVKDVVGYIDSNYRTLQSPESRGISGHSMGGYGCISISMKYPDLFGCVYAMSPGLLDKDGVAAMTNLNPALSDIPELKTLSKEDAHKKYMEMIPNFTPDNHFSLGYGSAFSPDPNGKAPYIKIPSGNKDNAVINAWNSGYGNFDEKVKKYKDNLKKLKALTIEYGKYDEYTWLPKGCEYFSQLLKAQGIKHELTPFEGGHEDMLNERYKSALIPFFSKNLKFD